MDKISIIVAAYNIEDFLPRCVDSILAQTYKELEIILVDDGSKDRTSDILDEYALKDSRIKVIHQENQGLSAARNSGLSIATGDYIGYVDGDDYISPQMYEKMLGAIKESGAELSVCGYEEVDVTGKALDNTCSTKDSELIVMNREEVIRTYLSDDREFHIYNSVWSKLFRRSIVEELRFPEGQCSEDIVYTMKALVVSKKCVFVNLPLYKYVVDRSGSIMNASEKLSHRRFMDELPFWREQTAILNKEGLTNLALISEYYYYRRNLFYFMDFKNRKMNADARRMAELIRSDRDNILKIYETCEASHGDLLRMKLFLFSPAIYGIVVNFYDKVIIPIRNM